MEDQKTTLYLSRILSGHYIFVCGGRRFKMVYPNTKLKYEAELVVEQEIQQNRFENWIKKEDITRFLISQGIWTQEAVGFLDKSEKTSEDLKVGIFQNFRVPNTVKEFRKKLASHRKTENTLLQQKHSFDHITLEGYAELIKNNYILSRSIYDENNELCFLDGNNVDLLEKVSFVISSNTISYTDFRKLSRCSQWSYYWGSRKSGNLFDAPIVDWTDEQRTLAALTRMYDNAREHPDAPSDEVFDDDDAFDGWAITERRKADKDKAKSRAEKMLPGNLKNANEVYVMARSREEARDVMELNDYNGKAIMKERNQVIQSQGTLKESELPDVRRDLIIDSNQKMVQHFRK